MQIDISTQEVCDGVYRSMGTTVTLEQVLRLWHSIGNIIRSQLEQKKGVKLDHFGSFSFDIVGDPCFNLSSEFKRSYKVRQVETPSHDNAPISKLNLTQLSRLTGLDRSLADKVYNKFITFIGGGLRKNKNVLITLHKVAEIFINNESVKVKFLADFLSVLGSKPTTKQKSKLTRPSSAPRVGSRQEGDVLDVSGHHSAIRARPSTPSGRARPPSASNNNKTPIAKQDKRRPPRAKRAVESVMTKNHNPILGDDDDMKTAYGRKRAVVTAFNINRNPILNDEEGSPSTDDPGLESESIYSDATRSSSRSSLQTPRYDMRSKARGLSQENLRKHNLRQNKKSAGVEDPRKMAARAIGSENIVEKIKEKIVARGGVNGIKGFSRLLAIMDDSGDRKLSRDELMYGLRDYGLNVSKTELEQLFLAFDRDGNGFIDVDEFLIGIRGDLNERRKALVKMAFDTLDTDGSGFVTVDELSAKYDVSCNPEVQQGKITPEEALQQFMKQWDRLDGDGMVSLEEFEDYYKGVSSSIDDDDYFELMIRNAWRIAGGKGACANTANKRVLVTNRDGSQRVVTVKNELGMKGGDVDAVRSRLAQQGIDAGDIELHGGVDTTGKAKKAGSRAPAGQQRDARRVAKEAWAAPRGEKASVPTLGASSRQDPAKRMSGGKQSKMSSGNNGGAGRDSPGEILRKALYDPPASAEQLATKLKVSSVGTQYIMKAAFLKRLAQINPKLSKSELSDVWTDLTRECGDASAASISIDDLHDYFGRKFGKDKSSKSNSVIDRVIAKILERCGGGGIKGLQRTLAVMDDNGDKRLSKEELKNGLRDYGIDLNLRELDDVYMMFDRDRNGVIDVDEFFIAIKGDLSERRKALVKMAFDTLDTDGSGFVTVDELSAKYDVSCNPEVQQGKITPEEALQQFMKQWDRLDGDGMVSLEEFEDYYKGVSSSIDGDDYFELMIRNAWRIAGGKGACANTANKRVLVTNRDGSQRVVTVKNELGMKGGDVDAVRSRLAQQGIDAGDIELHGGVDTTGKAKKAGAGAPKFQRHQAAEKLSSAFRGHKARKEVDRKKRATESARQRQAEYEEEVNREMSKKIFRPKGKSYSGF